MHAQEAGPAVLQQHACGRATPLDLAASDAACSCAGPAAAGPRPVLQPRAPHRSTPTPPQSRACPLTPATACWSACPWVGSCAPGTLPSAGSSHASLWAALPPAWRTSRPQPWWLWPARTCLCACEWELLCCTEQAATRPSAACLQPALLRAPSCGGAQAPTGPWQL